MADNILTYVVGKQLSASQHRWVQIPVFESKRLIFMAFSRSFWVHELLDAALKVQGWGSTEQPQKGKCLYIKK